MRVAFIGCGAICDYHAPAMKAAGLKVTAVCSRPGSKTAAAFAARHGVPHVFASYESLMSANDLWDALVIAVPPQASLPILERAVALRVPILVEKPASSSAAGLAKLLGREHPVIVGYNRRFYAPVQALREIVRASSNPFLGQLVMSEPISKDPDADPGRELAERVISNSVHALDLLRFLWGELELVSVQAAAGGATTGIVAILRAQTSGSLVNFVVTGNAPANVSLSLLQSDLHAVLKPFEVLRVYRSMRRLEPDPKIPWRRYMPLEAERVGLDEKDTMLKPGFYRQALALKRLVQGEKPQDAATLFDAYHALRLAERLVASLQSEALGER